MKIQETEYVFQVRYQKGTKSLCALGKGEDFTHPGPYLYNRLDLLTTSFSEAERSFDHLSGKWLGMKLQVRIKIGTQE